MNAGIFKPIDLVHGDEHLGRDIDQSPAAVQERANSFWDPEIGFEKDAIEFLAVEVLDDIDASKRNYWQHRCDVSGIDMKEIRGLLAQKIIDIRTFEFIERALMFTKYMQANVLIHAHNDKLPITTDKPDPEDARAAFNDSLPFLDE